MIHSEIIPNEIMCLDSNLWHICFSVKSQNDISVSIFFPYFLWLLQISLRKMSAFLFIINSISQPERFYCSLYILTSQFLKSMDAFIIDRPVSTSCFWWLCCSLLLQVCWIWLTDIFWSKQLMCVSAFMFAYVSIQINR